MSNLSTPPATQPSHIQFSDINETNMFNEAYSLDTAMYTTADQAQNGQVQNAQARTVENAMIAADATYTILGNEATDSDGYAMHQNINYAMDDNDTTQFFAEINSSAQTDANDNNGSPVETQKTLTALFSGTNGASNWNACQATFNEFYSDYSV